VRILTAFAADRLERGTLDRSARFLDDAFGVANNGATALERLSGAPVRRSWQVLPAPIILSPATLRLLSHKRPPG